MPRSYTRLFAPKAKANWRGGGGPFCSQGSQQASPSDCPSSCRPCFTPLFWMSPFAGWWRPLGIRSDFSLWSWGDRLFTENTLSPILPLLHHRDLKTLLSVLKLWGLVLVANIGRTWVMAFALAHTDIFEPRVWN